MLQKTFHYNLGFNWFVFLEEMKKSVNPLSDKTKVITANVNAINSFKGMKKYI